MYDDLTAISALADGLSLIGHIGHTDVRATFGAISPDYADYRVALSKTFRAGWSASAAVVGVNNAAFSWPPTGGLSAANGDTRDLNRPVVVVQVGRTF